MGHTHPLSTSHYLIFHAGSEAVSATSQPSTKRMSVCTYVRMYVLCPNPNPNVVDGGPIQRYYNIKYYNTLLEHSMTSIGEHQI